MTVMLRLQAECRDSAIAADVAARLERFLAPLALRAVRAPEADDEWSGRCWFMYRGRTCGRREFDAIVAACATGWHHGGEPDDAASVWNRAPGAVLIVPEVVFADLQCYDSPDFYD